MDSTATVAETSSATSVIVEETIFEPDIEWSKKYDSWVTFVFIWQSIASAVGILGNGSIFLLIVFVRSLRTGCHTLLGNLTIANILNLSSLLIFVVGLPRGVSPAKTSKWMDIGGSLRLGSSTVFILTLVSLSIERYQAIARPFACRSSPKVLMWSTIMGSWTCGLLSALTYSIIKALNQDLSQRHALACFLFTFGMYLIALVCMACCYSRCSRILMRRHRQLLARNGVNRGSYLRRHRQDLRLIAMLCTTTCVFMVSRAPDFVSWIWSIVTGDYSFHTEGYLILMYFVVIGDSLTPCVEPIVWAVREPYAVDYQTAFL
ncbi:C-C chemokine receptor type 7-like [Diadema antillarum]|uniref:C-C chemokine receptor type 7-like n=1 Tax=Diadema antillarum TaxID=105358 RepID=UPI003A84E0F6